MSLPWGSSTIPAGRPFNTSTSATWASNPVPRFHFVSMPGERAVQDHRQLAERLKGSAQHDVLGRTLQQERLAVLLGAGREAGDPSPRLDRRPAAGIRTGIGPRSAPRITSGAWRSVADGSPPSPGRRCRRSRRETRPCTSAELDRHSRFFSPRRGRSQTARPSRSRCGASERTIPQPSQPDLLVQAGASRAIRSGTRTRSLRERDPRQKPAVAGPDRERDRASNPCPVSESVSIKGALQRAAPGRRSGDPGHAGSREAL